MESQRSVTAYPDSKCCYGYMTLCDKCKPNAPSWVDTNTPIPNPPALGKVQRCESCDKKGVLK